MRARAIVKHIGIGSGEVLRGINLATPPVDVRRQSVFALLRRRVSFLDNLPTAVFAKMPRPINGPRTRRDRRWRVRLLHCTSRPVAISGVCANWARS